MNKIIGIYKLTSPSGKCYIGQSRDIIGRFRGHKSDTKRKHQKLYYGIRKYGYENFTKEILEECDQNVLDIREIYWINYYDSANKGYNCDVGGQIHKTFSKEHKEKLRQAAIKQNQDGRGAPSLEFYIDDILYKSISDASKKLGIPHKTVHNRLNSINQKYANYRYKDESRIPIRETRVWQSKPFQIDGIIYNTLKDASSKLNIPEVTLMRKLKNGKIPNSSYL
jgi:hypothetical protein